MNNIFSRRKGFLKKMDKVIRSEVPAEKQARDNELIECKHCQAQTTRAALRENLYVCPNCGFHGKLSAKARIKFTCDEGSFREFSRALEGIDPLNFPGYKSMVFL